MKRKPEDMLKSLAYALARLGMVKEATKLAKSNGTGTESGILKEIKDKIDKSIQACIAKKEVIEKLLNLQKEGKVPDKVSHVITKALMAPDEIFPKYQEKLEKTMKDMAAPSDIPVKPIDDSGVAEEPPQPIVPPIVE